MSDDAQTIDAESDPLLRVLTDALRSGPGTPEWRAATDELRTTAHGDEYGAILDARDRLAAGRSYRAVRPGPGFTRRVFAAIDDGDDGGQSARRRSPLSAGPLSYLGAGLVVAGLVLVLRLVLHAGGATTEDLGGLYNLVVASAGLDGSLSSEWRVTGPLAVDPAKGLLPAAVPASAPTDYLAGGIVTVTPVGPDKAFEVKATFRFNHVSDDCVPELFVADSPDPQAAGGHELAWVVRGGAARMVTPDGKLVGGPLKIRDGQLVAVRVVLGDSEAQVTCDGKPLWVGTSGLAGSPRYVGVRLLRRRGATAARDLVTVGNVRVAESKD